MNGETDVSWKFDRNRVGKGLYWVSEHALVLKR